VDHRHAVAYATLLCLVLALAVAAFAASRRWRSDRRQLLRFQRGQARRRDLGRHKPLG
jgi:hypothetical protein